MSMAQARTLDLGQARRTLRGAVRLVRPANLPTAAADALAGAAIVGTVVLKRVRALLAAASVLLYAGGVALNDVFDADLDAVERPERPIPLGEISIPRAFWLAVVLMASGIVAAFSVSTVAGMVATGVAYCAVVYHRSGQAESALGSPHHGRMPRPQPAARRRRRAPARARLRRVVRGARALRGRAHRD